MAAQVRPPSRLATKTSCPAITIDASLAGDMLMASSRTGIGDQVRPPSFVSSSPPWCPKSRSWGSSPMKANEWTSCDPNSAQACGAPGEDGRKSRKPARPTTTTAATTTPAMSLVGWPFDGGALRRLATYIDGV